MAYSLLWCSGIAILCHHGRVLTKENMSLRRCTCA